MVTDLSGVTFPARRRNREPVPLIELLLAVGPWILGPIGWRIGDCEFSSGSRGSAELARLTNGEVRLTTLKLVDLISDGVQLIDGDVFAYRNEDEDPFLVLASVRGDEWDVYSDERGLLDVIRGIFPDGKDLPAN
ncbi:hypothetical protein [uncultured Jatrophihabitans sp.]|uniref:hypothetical protein n=1 Tax=uncultured Jatrophihabitans sp. TaxID=1610747 RepID=UPI0035CB0A3B